MKIFIVFWDIGHLSKRLISDAYRELESNMRDPESFVRRGPTLIVFSF